MGYFSDELEAARAADVARAKRDLPPKNTDLLAQAELDSGLPGSGRSSSGRSSPPVASGSSCPAPAAREGDAPVESERKSDLQWPVSRFRDVHWNKRINKWAAQIRHAGQSV